MGMLPYVTNVQRPCVASNIFFWGVFHADGEDERLLITGTDGSTNVIGWNEIMVAFGAEQTEDEEFRAIKVMHKQLLPYRPGEFLPEMVERNPNRELVSGCDYEEVHYYKEAAPYGPTFYLMSVISELFWGHAKNPRFQTPQVYAYLRGLHGHLCNWAKAILKVIRTEIVTLQKLAKSEGSRRSIPVVWAPLFLHILYTYRTKIFGGSPLQEGSAWIQWQMTTKDGDIALPGLRSKFPQPVAELDEIRSRCKLQETIPVHVSSQDGVPMKPRGLMTRITKRKVANDIITIAKQQKLTPRKVGTRTANPAPPVATATVPVEWTVEKLADSLSADLRALMPGGSCSVGQGGCRKENEAMEVKLVALQERFNKVTSSSNWAKEVASKEHEAMAEKMVTLQEHLDKVTSSWNDAKTRLAEKDRTLKMVRSSEAATRAELEKLRAHSKTVENTLRAEVTAAHTELTTANNGKDDLDAARREISILKETNEKLKTAVNSEMDGSADLQLKTQGLKDKLAALKFKLDRAEEAQKEARTELATAKKQLRMFEIGA
ncbi:hypothetical protein R1sor_024001 [Riccia sorocarpa]|uniref:Aminotransferase-like plant mobile domain-containing protein n=1 Tax=Riccia sorocarpa TaxID=122646 RepID=A0ABD3GP89_9MARC